MKLTELPRHMYEEKKRALVASVQLEAERARDRASEQRREKELAASAESLLEIRDGAIRRGMTPVEAVKFADRIDELRRAAR